MPSANLHWQEHPGIGATRTDWIDDRPGVKHHSFSGVEVSCRHSERNAQVLKSPALQGSGQKRNHPIVGGKTVARQSPARETGEAAIASHVFHLGKRQSAAVAGTDQGSDAGARYHADRNAFLFEDVQNPYVSDAAGEASA